MKPKVCILTAGIGKRLGSYSKSLNKALLPLDGKAIISHIIGKFSPETEFVIAVGYKSEQVKTYLKMAHPELKIEFVQVENFDGPGSGPGLSTLSCQHLLDRDFYLVSSDTLWSENIESFTTAQSWMGVASVNPEYSQNFCNIQSENGKVVRILDKVKCEPGSTQAFIGLAFIKNPAVFWTGLKTDLLTDNEKQLSTGFEELMKKQILTVNEITWTDVGTEEKYVTELKKYVNFDFSKSNEYLFFVNGWVIKYFEDQTIALRRVQKSQMKSGVFPAIDMHENSFYRYKCQPGDTLYRQTELPLFKKLIDWLDKNFWSRSNVPQAEMIQLCDKFYRVKTFERIAQYNLKYPQPNTLTRINGKQVPGVSELLAAVDWKSLSDGVPCFIHGDLQPDNILYDKNSERFLLLDWRQDFAGRTEVGDIYYDLSKLWGGILLNYDQIKLNKFTYSESNDSCEFEFPSHPEAKGAHAILEKYIVDKGFSLQKVRLLVGLIYLNMSPLHHHPFDRMLQAMGREIVHASLSESAVD